MSKKSKLSLQTPAPWTTNNTEEKSQELDPHGEQADIRPSLSNPQGCLGLCSSPGMDIPSQSLLAGASSAGVHSPSLPWQHHQSSLVQQILAPQQVSAGLNPEIPLCRAEVIHSHWAKLCPELIWERKPCCILLGAGELLELGDVST